MARTYSGYSDSPDASGPAAVIVYETDPARSGALVHFPHHSPTGFAWGYLGSGPAELARCLLRDWLGYFPPARLYQDFKEDWVARWPQGGKWLLTGEQITAWLFAHPLQCAYCGAYQPADTHPIQSPACGACRRSKLVTPANSLTQRRLEDHACAACTAAYDAEEE